MPSTNFDSATGSTITGSVLATTGAGGTGVTFDIKFSGFPSVAEYGPFGKPLSSNYCLMSYLQSPQSIISTNFLFPPMATVLRPLAILIPHSVANFTPVRLRLRRLARPAILLASTGILLPQLGRSATLTLTSQPPLDLRTSLATNPSSSIAATLLV